LHAGRSAAPARAIAALETVGEQRRRGTADDRATVSIAALAHRDADEVLNLVGDYL